MSSRASESQPSLSSLSSLSGHLSLPELPPSSLLHTREPADQALVLAGGQLFSVLLMLVGLVTSPAPDASALSRILWLAVVTCIVCFTVWTSGLVKHTLSTTLNPAPSKPRFPVLLGLTVLFGLAWAVLVLLLLRFAPGTSLEALTWTVLVSLLLSSHYHAHGPLKRPAWVLLTLQTIVLAVAWMLLRTSFQAHFEAVALITVHLLSYSLSKVREREHEFIQRRASERVEEKRCLMQQIAYLQEAHSSKARLLAMVSHDLRQPVHALGLMLGRFRQDTSSSMRIEIEAVNDVVNSLSKSLTMLMAVTRLNSGQVVALPEAVSLERLFRSLANEMEETATASRLQLQFRSNRLSVNTDPNHLRTILANLISNAIRYTPQGGVQVVAKVCNPETVSIEVRDSGIGIPEQEISHIFEPFVRLHFRKTSEDGIGLGLAIVKQTADLIKAPIRVESVVGTGTTFTIELPLSQQISSAGAPMPDTYLRGLRVVVVDNDKTVLDSMARTMEEWGCRVIVAAGWEELDVKLGMTVSPIDLVVTDFHLDGGFSGYELIKRLRKKLRTRTPAILLTGDVEIRHGPESTATAVVIAYKPLSREKLALLIYDTVSTNAAQPAS
ncbi:MAG: ATP-binding protein [Hydrogenophaga sp.]|uniref:sensor histidine kinase n=1 Tax=Hydrogenophaga sp. TaxID=1904254 RepID=UPI003D0E8AF7